MTKFKLHITATVLVDERDMDRLRLDTRLGRQSAEYAVESHLADGPLLSTRQTELKVSLQEVLDVDRDGCVELVEEELAA